MRRARGFFALLAVIVAGLCRASPLVPTTVDPLSLAADYYFTRHEFRLALDLWSQVLRRQPDNLPAVLRVAELALLFQGRLAAAQAITAYLETEPRPLEARRAAEEKL